MSDSVPDLNNSHMSKSLFTHINRTWLSVLYMVGVLYIVRFTQSLVLKETD